MKRRGLKSHVVVFSTLTQHGAKETIEAIAFGADDDVTKPTQYDNPADAVEAERAELIPRIKAIVRSGSSPAVVPADGVAGGEVPAKVLKRVDLVGIGSSTGGPIALATVLSGLPKSLRVPVVIAQHMPPVYTTYLAQRLDTQRLDTQRLGEPLENGTVFVAPGDHHLTLWRTSSNATVALEQTPPVNHCRPSVDVLFQSAAAVFGGNVLGVVLTGMGHDGRDGAGDLPAAHGATRRSLDSRHRTWLAPRLPPQPERVVGQGRPHPKELLCEFSSSTTHGRCV